MAGSVVVDRSADPRELLLRLLVQLSWIIPLFCAVNTLPRGSLAGQTLLRRRESGQIPIIISCLTVSNGADAAPHSPASRLFPQARLSFETVTS